MFAVAGLRRALTWPSPEHLLSPIWRFSLSSFTHFSVTLWACFLYKSVSQLSLPRSRRLGHVNWITV